MVKADQLRHEARRWELDDQPLEFWHQEALKRIKASPVLDLGSGDGLLLSLLRQRSVSGVGLEISPSGLAKARARGLDVRAFDLLGSDPLPFANGAFPVVVILEVLEHLYAPQELLKEAARVLAPDGALMVSVPNFNSIAARLQVLSGQRPENNSPGKGHVYWMNPSILRRLLADAGFVVDDEVYLGVWRLKPTRAWLGQQLANALPSLFSLQFFMTARHRKP